MNFLKTLTQDEWLILISTPYKAGVWISHIDDNDKTKLDDTRERQALEYAIKKYSKMNKTMPFVAFLTTKINQRQNEWSQWALNSNEEALFDHIRQAITICKKSKNAKIIQYYKRLIWQIANIVASAYNENEDPDNEMHVDRFFAWIGSMMGPPPIKNIPENISEKEKSALKKLRIVLKE